MTIPDDIIQRFSLVETHEHTNNNSFIYNQRVFKIDIVGCAEWLAMECELDGKPSKYIVFYNTVSKQYLKTTLEVLEDVLTFPELIKLLL